MAETYTYYLHGCITDAGEVIDELMIDFGKDQVEKIDKDSFQVTAKASSAEYTEGTDVVSYGDYEITRTIVGWECAGRYARLRFRKDEGFTTAYLSSGRNVPVKLSYELKQLRPLEVVSRAADGRHLKRTVEAEYVCATGIINEETIKFHEVKVEGGLNYQFYEADKARTLIVWFHGNGEGDFRHSQNNVAQMLANRGTVAWADEAVQKRFDGAHVMAFQAPDTWYLAQADHLLEKAFEEIMAVVAKYQVDANKIIVAGCSAGGYMTTRMMIAYPDLFAAAMIACPALDIADLRGGKTPSDEELAGLRRSRTAVWLVQGETDGVVHTDACGQRMFDILTAGQAVKTKKFHRPKIADFTTSETDDGKYRLSLFMTTDRETQTDAFGKPYESGKLTFYEDYDQDGQKEIVKYSDHWAWIYLLNNIPQSRDGTSIMAWAAGYTGVQPGMTGDDLIRTSLAVGAVVVLTGALLLATRHIRKRH